MIMSEDKQYVDDLEELIKQHDTSHLDYLTGEDNSYEAFERWQESLGEDDDE
jgi:hypothetical protein